MGNQLVIDACCRLYRRHLPLFIRRNPVCSHRRVLVQLGLDISYNIVWIRSGHSVFGRCTDNRLPLVVEHDERRGRSLIPTTWHHLDVTVVLRHRNARIASAEIYSIYCHRLFFFYELIQLNDFAREESSLMIKSWCHGIGNAAILCSICRGHRGGICLHHLWIECCSLL